MKTKPKDTSIAVSANTTVTVSIKGQKFTLTKEEAQSLAKSLVDSVGLPVLPQKTVPLVSNEEFDRLKKAKEEYDKQRPIFPPRPYRPDPWDVPQWPQRPYITWTTTDAAPALDYSKFPPGTLLR